MAVRVRRLDEAADQPQVTPSSLRSRGSVMAGNLGIPTIGGELWTGLSGLLFGRRTRPTKAPPRLARSQRTFFAQQAQLAERYPNQWVAILGDECVGHGDDDLELRLELDPRHDLIDALFIEHVDADY